MTSVPKEEKPTTIPTPSSHKAPMMRGLIFYRLYGLGTLRGEDDALNMIKKQNSPYI